MSTDVDQTDVVIVGGGPVGLTASLLLARLGIRHILLERRPDTSIYPRAIGLSQRTMEVYRSLGIEDAIVAQSAPQSTYARSAWYTSFDGPTELHGRQLATRYGWGGGPYAPEYAATSPTYYRMLAQVRLDPLLRELAETTAPGCVRFGEEVTDIAQDQLGVTVTTELGDRERTIRASYLIGADGGRTVATASGIEYDGPTSLIDMVNVHFRADLSAFADRGVLMTFFVNPDFGGSAGTGFMYHIGPWDSAGTSKEWVFIFAMGASDPARFDDEAARLRLLRTLGVSDLPIEILSISHWQVESVVAQSYRAGRAFLVGDAAHRVPPSGGLGLNTGVADVRNLCWKLSLAVRDPRLAGILDSYEAERRPVAQDVASISLAGFRDVVGLIDGALGVDPNGPIDSGWSNIAQLWEKSSDGDARRSSLTHALELLDSKFHSYGAEAGFFYNDGALQPQQENLPFDPISYTATTTPGHHVPHFWITNAAQSRVSVTDVLDLDRFTLIVDAEQERWHDAVSDLHAPIGELITLIRVPGSGRSEDHDRPWSEIREVGPTGALLVRPDGIVAWRWTTIPSNVCSALDAALLQITNHTRRRLDDRLFANESPQR